MRSSLRLALCNVVAGVYIALATVEAAKADPQVANQGRIQFHTYVVKE